MATLPKTFLQALNNKQPNDLLRMYIKHYTKLQQKTTDFFIQQLFGKNTPANLNKYGGRKTTLKNRIEKEIVKTEIQEHLLLQQELLLAHLAKQTDGSCYFDYAFHYIKDLERKSNKGAEEYRLLAHIYREIHFHPNYNGFTESPHYFEASIKNREKYTLIRELQDSCELLNRCLITKQKLQQPIDSLFERAARQQEVVFGLYTDLLKLQTYTLVFRSEEAALFEYEYLSVLKNKLQLYETQLSDFDIKRIGSAFVTIVNLVYEKLDYTTINIAEGKRYIRNIFDVFKLWDERNILMLNNKIDYTVFISVAVVSTSLGAFEWYEYFKQKYQKYISTKGEASLILADKYSSFYKKDYRIALAEPKQVSTNEIFFKVHFRMHRLRCLYELYIRDEWEYDAILAELEAARLFFRREHIFDETKKNGFHHTIKFINKLVWATNNPSFSVRDKQFLKAKLLNTKPILSKEWLIEKVEEL